MTEGSGQCLVKTGEKQLYAQLYLLGEQREKECVGFKGKKHNHKLSIVKTTKCTSFSNLFYFVVAFYLFRTVHHQESKTIHTVSGVCQTGSVDCLLAGTGWNCSSISFPLASSQQNLFDIYLMLYVQYQTLDDERKDRPKHVECYYKIK